MQYKLLSIVLLLAVPQPFIHAAFIESFLPAEEGTTTASDPDDTSANHLPAIWQQLATIKSGGRGAVNAKGFALQIGTQPAQDVGGQPPDSAAETILLQWDKPNPANLLFYANKKSHEFALSDCKGTIKFTVQRWCDLDRCVEERQRVGAIWL